MSFSFDCALVTSVSESLRRPRASTTLSWAVWAADWLLTRSTRALLASSRSDPMSVSISETWDLARETWPTRSARKLSTVRLSSAWATIVVDCSVTPAVTATANTVRLRLCGRGVTIDSPGVYTTGFEASETLGPAGRTSPCDQYRSRRVTLKNHFEINSFQKLTLGTLEHTSQGRKLFHHESHESH